MEGLQQDLRFALRGWAKAPGFAVAAIAILGLGIGANTAIFSVVSGVLLRPLPFSRPDRLVMLSETQPRTTTTGGFDGSVIYSDMQEWRGHSRLLQQVVTYKTSSRNLQGTLENEQVGITAAESGLFELLGVAPAIGRAFLPDDPPNVVVASYRFWKSHFGDNRSIAGAALMLDGRPFTVVGVMPEDFQFPYADASKALYRSSTTDLWIPWAASQELQPGRRLDGVVARLRPGASAVAARQELNAMSGPAQSGRVVHVRTLKDAVSGSARESLLVLLGAVGMVLLAACANVANLLLARTASRTREIAIRTALGATRIRIMRQFLTESLLFSLCGGLAGLALGRSGSAALVHLAAAQIPRAEEIGFDWRVFGFLLLVCLITGIVAGLAPAFAAARGGEAALKTRTLGTKLRDGLVIVEVALAFILLAGAGLLLRTFLNLQHTDPGLNAGNALTLHVVVSGAPESLAIEDRVSRIPGVRAAGLISLLPLQNSGWSGFFRVPGRPGLFESELRYVSPGYFRAMSIPLRKGRVFSLGDGPRAESVILVNEALARRYFPGADPVGVKTDRGLIIGVVGDVRQDALSLPAVPEIYNPVAQNFAQMSNHGSTLIVRTDGAASAMLPAVRAAVREVSPGQAIFRAETMRQVLDDSLAGHRLYLWLLGVFAIMGTLLAVAGIYGVIAYVVALRTREFGIRMALGAGTSGVLRLVMVRGALVIGVGLALGIVGAAGLTSVLRGMLYGVVATDPATFFVMTAILAGVSMAACIGPARRATQIDPAVALRSE
jgi:putative ABC transport system permease protein